MIARSSEHFPGRKLIPVMFFLGLRKATMCLTEDISS